MSFKMGLFLYSRCGMATIYHIVLIVILYERQIKDLAISLSLSELFGQNEGTRILVTFAFLLRLSK